MNPLIYNLQVSFLYKFPFNLLNAETEYDK